MLSFCVSFSHKRKPERNERILFWNERILFHKIPTLDSDFVRVSASESVPQTILASQDNGENEQEIVDLTVETVNAVSTVSDDANVTATATPERVLQTPKSKQEKVAAVKPLSEDQKKSTKKPTAKLEENEKGPVVGGRRAKSSYR